MRYNNNRIKITLTYDALYDALSAADFDHTVIARFTNSPRCKARDNRNYKKKIRSSNMISLALMAGLLLEESHKTRQAIKAMRTERMAELEELDKQYERDFDKNYWNSFD